MLLGAWGSNSWVDYPCSPSNRCLCELIAEAPAGHADSDEGSASRDYIPPRPPTTDKRSTANDRVPLPLEPQTAANIACSGNSSAAFGVAAIVILSLTNLASAGAALHLYRKSKGNDTIRARARTTPTLATDDLGRSGRYSWMSSSAVTSSSTEPIRAAHIQLEHPRLGLMGADSCATTRTTATADPFTTVAGSPIVR